MTNALRKNFHANVCTVDSLNLYAKIFREPIDCMPAGKTM